MNSDKNEAEELPDGWTRCISKSNPGRKYYFNRKTGKSLWTEPQAVKNASKREDIKQKSQKEKDQAQEKRKEELEKKNLKRKSYSSESSPTKKKQRSEFSQVSLKKASPVTPVNQKSASPQKQCDRVDKKDSTPKAATSKNIANVRLTNLREQLSAEVQALKEVTTSKNIVNSRLANLREHLSAEVQALRQLDQEQSSFKSQLKTNPETSHAEMPGKIPKSDLKSPNLNETKCTSAQSPSSDSIPSVPSPSQFYTANKIIYSIKAQLTEGFSEKLRQKDTFADIEEGISSQTTEFPYMKHPVTPPQFSEASKLMSAIKSKLSCKAAQKDIEVKTSTPAQDRLDKIRAIHTNESKIESCKEITDEEYLSRIELPPSEAMDVDFREIKSNTVAPMNQCKKDDLGRKENIVLVVDTNIFIHELDVIKNVINSHIKGYAEQPTLLVPWRVINELDRLKDNNNGNGAICKRARAAMDYLYKSLPETSRIKGQSLRDSNSHIYPCESPDDEILNCCLQQAERGESVMLLSNDKNLCNKAAINGVRYKGLDELKPLLENKPQPITDPDLLASVQHYENNLHVLLSTILENEMRAKYDNVWTRVVLREPPWSFIDVIQCLLKHWMAVFNEVFPRNVNNLLSDLNHIYSTIQGKDPKSISPSEVTNFKEICMEIARKCLIIPDYLKLAKATVERLQTKCANETKDEKKGGEMLIIGAFERLWTLFSSYCAKLATALNISHNLEDQVPSNDSLAELTSRWPLFNSQLKELSAAMQGLLNVTPGDNTEEQMTQLEIVFKESLAVISYDSTHINQENIGQFCNNCRNLLQEACSKFSELSNLLDVCREVIANQHN